MTPREELIELWSKSKFGVKTKVLEVVTERTIRYILATPSYSKDEVIQDIINTIKEKAKDVKDEVNEMYNEIQGV